MISSGIPSSFVFFRRRIFFVLDEGLFTSISLPSKRILVFLILKVKKNYSGILLLLLKIVDLLFSKVEPLLEKADGPIIIKNKITHFNPFDISF
jgi:hypothetical protein